MDELQLQTMIETNIKELRVEIKEEIRDLRQEMRDNFNTLVAKMEEVNKSVNNNHTSIAIIKDQNLDDRVSALETFRWKLAGVLIVLQFILTSGGLAVVKFLLK